MARCIVKNRSNLNFSTLSYFSLFILLYKKWDLFIQKNYAFITGFSVQLLAICLIIYDYFRVLQAIASVFIITTGVSFLSLYSTLVCVACSQLEKLKAALLFITQTNVMSQQDCGVQSGQQEGQGQGHTSKDVFLYMQKQLNACIRHHQDIKRCGYSQES
jgi:hypothetical protein